MPSPAHALSLLLLGGLLAGCASSQPEPSAPPSAAGESAREVPSGTGQLRIENRSGRALFKLWIEVEGQWGEDRLSRRDVIQPGVARSFEVPAGSRRVQVAFENGSRETWGPVEVPREGVALVQIGAQEQTLGALAVENKTPWTIAQIRFSSSSTAQWGPERLGAGQVLARGARRSWRVPPGRYQLRIQFQDGTAQETETPYVVRSGKETVFTIEGE